MNKNKGNNKDIWENNVFKRIYQTLLTPKDTFENITKKPTRFSIILAGILLLYGLIFYFLFFHPNIWKNIFFIQFSGLSLLSLIGIFFIIVIIFALIFVSILLITNFIRQLITKRGKKKKLVVLNYYFYSLVPFIFLLTQLPFIFIFNGYYQLLGLNIFYIGFYILVLGLHVYYFSIAIGVGLDLSWKKTIFVGFIFSLLILGLFIFIYWVLFYSNISYSWLGSLI
ncbi:MAG: hypothetical protein GF329_14385 [Candidatus Lokiarchaeota archaeon]|nr:hypothetical protein [Candidatus Lokiarchaeota archaeon]